MKAVGFGFALASLLAGCSDEPEAAIAAPPLVLPTPTVPLIAGNDVHNQIAAMSELDRGLSLANIVKSIEGIPRCSAERLLFRGTSGQDAFWSIQCHTGESYSVLVKASGDGAVLDCGTPKALGIGTDCWTPFPVKASGAPRAR